MKSVQDEIAARSDEIKRTEEMCSALQTGIDQKQMRADVELESLHKTISAYETSFREDSVQIIQLEADTEIGELQAKLAKVKAQNAAKQREVEAKKKEVGARLQLVDEKARSVVGLLERCDGRNSASSSWRSRRSSLLPTRRR